MKRTIKVLSASLLLLLLATATAGASGNAVKSSKGGGFNWNPVMDAIIQVESEGNPRAVSGNSAGAMQITPILVKDCNDILKKRKSKKRYTLTDRFDVGKSKEMFLLIQSHYNPLNSIEKAIRLWNGGVNYSVRSTNRYYKKVMKNMK